ncbi:hypothetical protein FQN50_000309 [Emmonsiellopsis sp. PD_5]|nr:hypothetical protein FQN50_000309 [Emmonsiellopsis sp. PD_5]
MTLETQWANIVECYSPASIEVVGAAAVQATLVVIFGAYAWVGAEEKRRRTIRKMLPAVFGNVVIAAAVHIAALRLMSLWHGISVWDYSLTTVSPKIPSGSRLLMDLMSGVFFFEIFFYYLHALMHTKWLYRHVHSIHHRSEEVSIAAFHSHPVEYLTMNFGMITGPPVLISSHVLSLLLNGAVAGVVALYVHSGDDLPGLMSHEGHHLKPNRNLGAVGILDWVHGTQYHSSPVQKKH